MEINGKISPINTKKPIEVAVAVLAFEDELLLARRQAHQHQGDKWEFVGGKIEPNETPIAALCREVKEEISLDISANLCVKLGRIEHDYDQKSVILHVYWVALTSSQYQHYHNQRTGAEGQRLGFFNKSWVLAHQQQFPCANKPIFRWLTLPSVVVISHALAEFADESSWVDYYAQKLPKNSVFLPRLQTNDQIAWRCIHSLNLQRKDIDFIIPWQIYLTKPDDGLINVFALRLTQQELLTADLTAYPTNIPLIASCHDKESIDKLNGYTKTLPVLGAFLSPVLTTLSHPNEPALGWAMFNTFAKELDVPVLALGGLTLQDLPTAQTYGAMGVAGIRRIF